MLRVGIGGNTGITRKGGGGRESLRKVPAEQSKGESKVHSSGAGKVKRGVVFLKGVGTRAGRWTPAEIFGTNVQTEEMGFKG